MWLGELDVVNSDGAPDVRRYLLGMLFALPDRKRVRIFPDAASMRGSVKGQPKAIASLDTRTSIVLPDDFDHWDAAVIEAASAKLAFALLEDYSQPFLVLLMMQTATRAAFERYCLAKRFTLPQFWFGRRSQKVSSAKARSDCHIWLKGLVAAGPKHASKAALWREANKKFPHLSERGFEEVWARTVPAEWRSAGAPKSARASGRSRSARRR
jgi:hypothetical protein